MIRSSVNKNAFLFIDPPYFNADQDKFYEESFKYEDHVRLANLLKEFQSEFNFLLTYDNCQEIRDLYSWTSHINPQEWNYTISRTDDQKQKIKLKDGHSGTRKKGKEIFITNYDADKLDINF